MIIFQVFGFLCVVFVLWNTFKMFGKPSENNERRMDRIKELVEDEDLRFVSAERTKKAMYPYQEDLVDDGSSVYVPYKVVYLDEYLDEHEGWALLIVGGTIAGSSAMTKNRWIMKL